MTICTRGKLGRLGAEIVGYLLTLKQLRGELDETPSYFDRLLRRHMITYWTKEKDAKAKDHDMAILGRLRYAKPRLPGEIFRQCKEERKVYIGLMM